VNLQVAFKKTSRLDDVLEWSLEVRRLGTKSRTLWVSARCQGEERITMEVIIVMVNLIPGGISSLAIPADIRTGMEKYLAG
jgi:4-hydroxybenzoyl-CoA thioesterase